MRFPLRGRLAGDGVREIAIVAPYVISYQVDQETVFIVGIRHGRQLPPEE